jgi:hypothetical protein
MENSGEGIMSIQMCATRQRPDVNDMLTVSAF